MHDRHGFAGGWAGKLAHAPASIATELTHSAVKASWNGGGVGGGGNGGGNVVVVEAKVRVAASELEGAGGIDPCRVVLVGKVEVAFVEAVTEAGEGGGGEGGGGLGGEGGQGGKGAMHPTPSGNGLGEEAGVSWAAMEPEGLGGQMIHAVGGVGGEGGGGCGGGGDGGGEGKKVAATEEEEKGQRGRVMAVDEVGDWRVGGQEEWVDMEEVEDMEEVNTTLAEEDSEDANASAVEVAVAGKYTMEATLTLPLVTPLSDTSEVDTPAEAAIWALNSARKVGSEEWGAEAEVVAVGMVAVPLPLALSAVMYTIGGGGLGSGGGDGGGGGLGGGGDGEEKVGGTVMGVYVVGWAVVGDIVEKGGWMDCGLVTEVGELVVG
ncbi:hypothetical protein CYMTET_27128 [Cymbomonas tetramitiformis]|uniref:Uncharacterized protein n=1 Tax=Cymbomonas tetramitiformis TaxID=36881 RepID=A0AAE0KX81_9CHLO|nr:hypothetical protein CYMTET_27128 [Cymbomonas tetramitiformis]